MVEAMKAWGRRHAHLSAVWGRIRWYTTSPGIRQVWLALRHFGWSVKCPICGWRGRAFYPYGVTARRNAMCPRCYSVERHRVLYLFLTQLTPLLTGAKRVLEIAPGPYSYRLFKHRPGVLFVGADLESPLANCRSDLMSLPFSAGAFDLVICYHVLEHIPQDRAAIQELHRVLNPGGTALVHVPIERDVTFELENATSPQDRLRLFGQSDHVRSYGFDLADRLSGAGFQVEIYSPQGIVDTSTAAHMGLNLRESIFVCRKPFV